MQKGEKATGTGRVKFFKAGKGWGGIEDPSLPGDVWFHVMAIDMPGYRELSEGQRVELTYERADQDSWRYRAISVKPLGQ